MISLGLSAAKQKDFSSLLTESHVIRVTAQLLDLNHNRISDISQRLLDGQVQVDLDADITRSASLVFLDPQHLMALDSNSPGDGAMYMDRMIQLAYTVASPDWTRVYHIPIFCGPITKMDRDWAVVRIECMGKEILALDPVWAAKTYKKGARKSDVIRDLLAQVGETKFSLKYHPAKLPKDLAVSSETKPWIVARQLASQLNYQLFYDGRGVAVMRSYPTAPLWTFTEGRGGSLLSKVQVGYDMANVINACTVKGAIPKGKKTPIIYRATAPKGHPLHPLSLGRGGKPRFISVEINDNNIDTLTEARAVATDRVNRGLYEAVTAAFDSLPIPHLEPHDPIRIATSEHSTSTIMRKMTIPLVVSQSASFGYLRSLRPNKTNIRRKR